MRSGVKEYKTPTGIYFCIFIFFIVSMGCNIGWDGRDKYLYLIASLFSFYLILSGKIKTDRHTGRTPLLILLLASYIYAERPSVLPVIAYIIPAYFILMLNETDRKICISYILKLFAYLMIPCVVTYIFVESLDMPYLNTILVRDPAKSVLPLEGLTRRNYIFYTPSIREVDGLRRFCGPFIEPGHLGMMLAFLLFADGFDFKKKETIIALVSLLFTFSLGGWVLSFIGYVFTRYEQRKISFKWIASTLILLLAAYLFATLYKGGDNVFNEKILSRLEYSEENGIEGNNRVFGQIDLYFASMFNNSRLLLFGYGKETMQYLAETGSRGSGFQIWFVEFGIIGTLITLSFYIVVFLLADDKRKAALFLLFFLICFMQRSKTFWYAWIICYLYGMSAHGCFKRQKKPRSVSYAKI